ncbi:MAG TPA: hypothetical protein VGJ06_03970 [Candidatus Acidoferrum sp.]
MKRLVPARVVVSVFFAAAFLLALTLTLALSAPLTLAITPTFTAGQTVATTGIANIRATGDGTLIGQQAKGAIGTVLAGPVTVAGNSVIWYHVNFATAPSGWVGGDLLVASGNSGTAPPKSVVVGNGTAQTMVLDEFGGIEIGFISADANNNPTYSFSESTNQGLTFSAPSLLPMKPTARVPEPPTGPVIAAERNGAIDIVYACLGTDCPGHFGNQSVQLVRSTDHGVTWSAPVQISLPTRPSGFGAQEPVIAACGAGVTIAWQDDGTGANFGQTNPDIILVNVVNGIPGTSINVTNSAASEGHPQIAVNAQSNVFVSWVTNNQNTSTSTPFNSVAFAAVPNCGAVQK